MQAKRDRDAEILRTKFTVSVKGSRDDRITLMTTLAHRFVACDKCVIRVKYEVHEDFNFAYSCYYQVAELKGLSYGDQYRVHK